MTMDRLWMLYSPNCEAMLLRQVTTEPAAAGIDTERDSSLLQSSPHPKIPSVSQLWPNKRLFNLPITQFS